MNAMEHRCQTVLIVVITVLHFLLLTCVFLPRSAVDIECMSDLEEDPPGAALSGCAPLLMNVILCVGVLCLERRFLENIEFEMLHFLIHLTLFDLRIWNTFIDQNRYLCGVVGDPIFCSTIFLLFLGIWSEFGFCFSNGSCGEFFFCKVNHELTVIRKLRHSIVGLGLVSLD